MAKEIKGEDGKTYVVNEKKPKKPWYKRWWVWLIIAIVVIFVFIMAASGGSDDDSSDSSSSNTTSTTQSSSSKNKGYVTLDGEDIYYTQSKDFKVNSTDTSWKNATATVDSATVYKVKDGYTYGTKKNRKTVQGILAVTVSVKAIKDIQVLMNIGTISIPSINEQSDVSVKDDWGDLDKGMSKTGTVYIPVYNLKNVNDIKSFRFKFDCQLQDTDDSDDDSLSDYDHTYDMTINLNE
ncbi:hypothetical protein [Lactobacillus sp.]|uniref:hypothetical protein n=1 Tax=Lactobacillus sp. TaxID=1591 RepID=UPI0025B94720|nr:hypothetical protein [Lactobacillus sp.]